MKINFNNQIFGAKIKNTAASKRLENHFNRQCDKYSLYKNYDKFCISVDCILPEDSDEVTFHYIEKVPYPDRGINIKGTISRKDELIDFCISAPIESGCVKLHRSIIDGMKQAIKKGGVRKKK